MRARVLFGVVLLAFAGLDCGGEHEKATYVVVAPPRDWALRPAIVVAPFPSGPGPSSGAAALFAMSDVHGGYDRMVALLAAHHVIASPPPTPEAVEWSGGASVLVVAGDLFDKGPAALEALDLLRALEPKAAAAGGRVVVTLGNHEAEFLDDPENEKATKDDGVDAELGARGLSPIAVASGADPRGAWLRDRPFGARIGAWFFSHGGNTGGRTLDALGAALRASVTASDYHGDEIVGGASLLEARNWYGGSGASTDVDGALVRSYASALGAEHIVFGHDPNALGARGDIALAADGMLVRIDCGMSPTVDDGTGRLLRVRRDGAVELAESLSADGSAREIWRRAR